MDATLQYFISLIATHYCLTAFCYACTAVVLFVGLVLIVIHALRDDSSKDKWRRYCDSLHDESNDFKC